MMSSGTWDLLAIAMLATIVVMCLIAVGQLAWKRYKDHVEWRKYWQEINDNRKGRTYDDTTPSP